MKSVAVACCILCCSVAEAACLSYSGTVTIAGRLSRHTFPEQPNYESIAKGDAPASYIFVLPRNSVCVEAGGTDEPGVPAAPRIQLMFDYRAAKQEYDRLTPLLGKNVVCTGSLFPAATGHHHSKVLLQDARCHAA